MTNPWPARSVGRVTRHAPRIAVVIDPDSTDRNRIGCPGDEQQLPFADSIDKAHSARAFSVRFGPVKSQSS